MAKRMKRMLAIILTLSMCMSLLSVQAAATTTQLPETGEGTYEEPKYIGEVTVTVEIAPNGDTTTETKEETSWKGVTVKGSDELKPTGKPGVSSSNTVTQTVAGSETKVDSVTTDKQGRPVTEYRSVKGSEKTTYDETNTTATTTEDVYQDDLSSESKSTTVTKTENGVVTSRVVDGIEQIQSGTAVAPSDKKNEGQWVNGQLSTPGDWQIGEEQYGETPAPVVDPETTGTAIDASPDSIAIGLKPGETKTEQYTINAEALFNENKTIQIPQAGTENILDENGEIIGTVVTEVTELRDSEGKVYGYEVTKTTAKNSVVNVPTDEEVGDFQEEDPSGFEYNDPTATQPNKPVVDSTPVPVYDPETGEKIGETVSELKEIYEDGKLVGYEIIKTTTTTTVDEEPKTSELPTTEEKGETVETFELPERPAESDTTDPKTGEVTKVTVEEILDADGEVIGYKSITVKTDANGVELSRATESVYGTTTISEKTTTIDPTTEQVTTTVETTIVETTTISAQQESREVELQREREVELLKQIDVSKEIQYIQVDGDLYYVYSAEMGAVEKGADHGKIVVSPSLMPSQAEPSVGNTDTSTDLYHRANSGDYSSSYSVANGYQLVWKGEYGLESAIRVKSGGTGEWDDTYQPHQFILYDKDGNAYYVYCADFEVNPQEGFSYKMTDVTAVPNYYTEDEAKHINAIALNGYWGTESGVGSLAALQEQLRNAPNMAGLTEDQINSITPGQALTATQAAIWLYGNSGTEGVDTNDPVGRYYDGSSFSAPGTEDEVVTKAIYDYLITLTEEPAEVTPIDEGYITGAEITIRGKYNGADNEYKAINEDDDNTNDVYDTDISFTLAFEPSQINDDLIVTVIADGEVVATRRLAGATADGSDGLLESVDGKYTIEGIALSEDVNVTLNLEGLQHISTSAFLCTSEVRTSGSTKTTSQNFVGVSTQKQKVDLSVDLKFSVQESEVTMYSGQDEATAEYEGTRVDTQSTTRTDTRHDEYTNVESVETEETTVNTKVYADITITEVVESSTHAERTWESESETSYTYPELEPYSDDAPIDEKKTEDETPEVELPEEDVPLAELPDEEVPLVELPDEEVPLSDIPKTGDPIGMWMLLSLLSGSGLVLLNKKREDEE